MVDWELWGTFSVGDHLRKNAFVADLLLYDQLVVPVPPEDDAKEYVRWEKIGWEPARQQRILEIAKSRVVSVPWNEGHRTNWEENYLKAKGQGLAAAELRTNMAAMAAQDVASATAAKVEFEKRNGQPEEVDQLAHFTTRGLLANYYNTKSDTVLFRRLPRAKVEAVVAYGSPSDFQEDYPVQADVSVDAGARLEAYGWEFLIPADSKRSHEDLLKQAVELASLEETAKHRHLFHEWRSKELFKGKTDAEIRDELEERIEAYRKAVLRTKIITATEYAFAFLGAGLAAVAVPALGVPGAIVGLGSFLIAKHANQGVPENLQVAAMFHDARKGFGWN